MAIIWSCNETFIGKIEIFLEKKLIQKQATEVELKFYLMDIKIKNIIKKTQWIVNGLLFEI